MSKWNQNSNPCLSNSKLCSCHHTVLLPVTCQAVSKHEWPLGTHWSVDDTLGVDEKNHTGALAVCRGPKEGSRKLET